MLANPAENEKAILVEHRRYLETLFANSAALFDGGVNVSDRRQHGLTIFEDTDDSTP